MTTLNADIAIVGSGAAGGVLAATLAEFTTKKIVLIEKGGYYTKDWFDQRELDMNVLYAERGARTTQDGAIPVQGGECVGGGTTVNYALSFDPRQDVWNHWKREFGVGPFSFERSSNDFGIGGLNMAAALADVRKRINVHPPGDGEINDNNKLFAAGCKALHIPTKRFELNMIDCIGCGYCGQGCAYDRKLSTMVTYVADAQRRGVQIVHHCDIEAIEFSRGVLELRPGSTAEHGVAGVRGVVRPTASGSQPNSVAAGPISIAAPLVIVSAGAIGSPALLQRSKYPDPQKLVGKGLVLHPSLPIAGVFGQTLTNYRGITGAYYSDHYYGSHGFYLECLFDHPLNAAVALPGIGLDHFQVMSQYTKLAGFGVMLVDTPDPHNQVAWDDSRGAPAITYRVSESDKSRLRLGARTGVEIMLAAGAKEAIITSEELLGGQPARFTKARDAALCENLQFAPCETLLVSSHAQASVKMGEDLKRSVVNSRGESRVARNLIVCDASVFPTSCGANPMISVMTLARYQGKRIAGELARYGLA